MQYLAFMIVVVVAPISLGECGWPGSIGRGIEPLRRQQDFYQTHGKLGRLIRDLDAKLTSPNLTDEHRDYLLRRREFHLRLIRKMAVEQSRRAGAQPGI